jgi:aminoglycoside phosphotransferase (APT) family kinase protein
MQRLAGGASAEVFALDANRVLKLFRREVPRGVVQREAAHARWAHAQGLPVPRPLDVVRQEARHGIVFERCDGPTLFEALRSGTRAPADLATLFFELQQQIHRAPCELLLPLQPALAHRIAAAPGVGDDLKTRALAIAQARSERSVACHGDFHPQNVILWQSSAVVVDWLDLGWADPALDVNRTLLFLLYAHSQAVATDARDAFVQTYRRLCRQAWSGRTHELARWVLPVAVARLARPGLEAVQRAALTRVAHGEVTPWE